MGWCVCVLVDMILCDVWCCVFFYVLLVLCGVDYLFKGWCMLCVVCDVGIFVYCGVIDICIDGDDCVECICFCDVEGVV